MPPILGIVFLAEAFEGSDVHQQRWTNIVAQVTAPVTDGGLGMTRRQANAFYTQAVNSICGVLFERSFSPASINQEAFYLFVWKLLYASFCKNPPLCPWLPCSPLTFASFSLRNSVGVGRPTRRRDGKPNQGAARFVVPDVLREGQRGTDPAAD